MSKGIFEEISWSEIEDILVDSASLQELAERMVDAAEQKKIFRRTMGASY